MDGVGPPSPPYTIGDSVLLFAPNNLLLAAPARYSLYRFGVLELVAAGKNRNKAAHWFGQEEEEEAQWKYYCSDGSQEPPPPMIIGTGGTLKDGRLSPHGGGVEVPHAMTLRPSRRKRHALYPLLTTDKEHFVYVLTHINTSGTIV